jgi:hypothetical protein
MKIDSSAIKLESSRKYFEQYKQTESLEVTINPEVARQHQERIGKDIAEISDKANKKCCEIIGAKNSEALTSDTKLGFLILLIEKFTGKKVKILDASKLENEHDLDDIEYSSPDNSNQPERVGWGVAYDYHESYQEEETTAFQARGIVRTQDGQKIKFKLQLNMHREYYEQVDVSFRAGDAAIDPLVINFNGNAAELSDTKFEFDLNADGQTEMISRLGAGSGFLALDKNTDNIINDGSELFGPKTGQGFLELSEYDTDGNQWIDENDNIYNKLRIWTQLSDGTSSLSTLKEKNIGAIYLGNADTAFSITDADNSRHGIIRSSGVYLQENGQAGTIQQIDLVA